MTSSPPAAWSCTSSCCGTPRYLNAIIENLREDGQQVLDEDVTRLSPSRSLTGQGVSAFGVTAKS